MQRLRKLKAGAVAFAVLIAVWAAAVRLFNVNPALFPPPTQVARAFGELWTTGLAGGSSALPLPVHIGVSLGRFAAGYALAAVCGIGLGLLFGLFPGVFDYANPVVQLLRPIAPVAWMPFIVLWFGIGDAPAVAIIFIAGFFPVLLATARAVGQIAPIYWQVADNFGMNGWQKITKIVCPAAFPQNHGESAGGHRHRVDLSGIRGDGRRPVGAGLSDHGLQKRYPIRRTARGDDGHRDHRADFKQGGGGD